MDNLSFEPVPEPATLALAACGLALCLARLRRFRSRRAVAGLVLGCAASLWSATVAQAVVIPTIPVGNAGNAGDVQSPVTFGAVAYDYRIGTYEVTIGQYTEFLNAVAAADTYGLYNPAMATDLNIAGIARAGISGAYTYNEIGSPNKPITYVSWGDAARFANWLHNGQPTGAQDASTTEDGAYALGGATSDAALMAVTRKVGATWVVPSGDEWHKAAYHKNDGMTANYWDFPTSSDSPPDSDQPPGNDAPDPSNTANLKIPFGVGYNEGYAVTGSPIFDASQNYLTDVGAYTQAVSPYGTHDQAGNVNEWHEAIVSGTARGLRGGAWSIAYGLASSLAAGGFAPTTELDSIGFRVALIPDGFVPEPSTLALAGCGLLGLAATGLRSRRRRWAARVAGFAALLGAASSIDTASASTLFVDPLFGVNVTQNVQYGTNVDGGGNPVVLDLDVYQPTGAGLPATLPGIVLMHGGSFVDGNKSNMATTAFNFASRGYVAVSINYRKLDLLPPPPGASPAIYPERNPDWLPGALAFWGVTQQQYADTIAAAVGDQAMAANWLAANSPTYNIDPSKIAIGGYSAGAVSSLMLGAGAIDGASADVAVVLSIAGGMFGHEIAIDTADPGIFVVHSTADTTVPFTEVGFLETAVAAAGVPYDSLIFEGVSHTQMITPLFNNPDPMFVFMAGELGLLVPEPPSLALAACGIGLLVAARWGQRWATSRTG
jgi:acetyl esterase/lipase/formylglycine-generating enzyme required for sulfatase activity